MEEPTRTELFITLQDELVTYLPMLGEAIDKILESEVTSYPIFIVHQQKLSIGIPIVDKDKVSGNWSVNMSTLEEFTAKQLIAEEKVQEFKATYKNPDAYICIFSLSELGAQFIFLPRKSKK